MEDLVDQDSLELARLGQESGIEQNDPPWNVRGRQVGPQRTAESRRGWDGRREAAALVRYFFGGTMVKPDPAERAQRGP